MKTTNRRIVSPEQSIDFELIEKQWRESLTHYTNVEWLELNPDLCKLFPDKIHELKAEQQELIDLIRETLRVTSLLPEWSEPRLVIELTLRITLLDELIEVEQQLRQFIWLNGISDAKSNERLSVNYLSHAEIEVARHAPILDIVGRSIELKRSGTTYRGLCPFHVEKTASFTIWPETSRWYCFGCNEGGDVIDYLERSHNMTFFEAVRWLSKGVT